jgi:hypothetical protein
MSSKVQTNRYIRRRVWLYMLVEFKSRTGGRRLDVIETVFRKQQANKLTTENTHEKLYRHCTRLSAGHQEGHHVIHSVPYVSTLPVVPRERHRARMLSDGAAPAPNGGKSCASHSSIRGECTGARSARVEASIETSLGPISPHPRPIEGALTRHSKQSSPAALPLSMTPI